MGTLITFDIISLLNIYMNLIHNFDITYYQTFVDFLDLW